MATPTINFVSASLVAKTGNTQIDSLLWGTKWGPGGSGVTLTYSFPQFTSYWSLSSYPQYATEPWSADFYGFNNNEQARAVLALRAWSNVANVNFVQSPDNQNEVGEIRFAYTSKNIIETAGAYPPNLNNFPKAGDIWFGLKSPTWISSNYSFIDGSYGFVTLIHELGHALGLKHPFQGSNYPTFSDVLPSNLDSYKYTIMSYSKWAGYSPSGVSFNPTTPMLLDIAAIQRLYGANYNFNASDNIYNFTQGGNYFQTIWDGGGSIP